MKWVDSKNITLQRVREKEGGRESARNRESRLISRSLPTLL